MKPLSLLFMQLLVKCALSINPSCIFSLGKTATTYNLSNWNNVTLQGNLNSGVEVHTSLCDDLPQPCIDVLTGRKIYGSTVIYTYDDQCWDTIAQWTLFPPTASPLPSPDDRGLVLSFRRPGDAHLDCPFVNVTVSVLCDANAPFDPAAARLAGEQDGCAWRLSVRTSDSSICI
jgi:hypothetical protein